MVCERRKRMTGDEPPLVPKSRMQDGEFTPVDVLFESSGELLGPVIPYLYREADTRNSPTASLRLPLLRSEIPTI
jgi:hypothetical protein